MSKTSFSYTQRPLFLKDFIGQKHLVGNNAPIANMLKNNKLMHMFFYGPSGVGKTSLARIIANEISCDFIEFNATSIKIDEIRKVIAKYENSLTNLLIFIDEVHRLNKMQQEVLLPIMENFDAIIIGASTENPYFSLNASIRSRSFIFEFKLLNNEDLLIILDSALLSNNITISSNVKDYLISNSNGDARFMLNLLNIVYESNNIDDLKEVMPIKDSVSSSNTHYDLISALIKSIRGSDENASIYYLARLLDAKEDIEYIARRLVILASEDIGNANPNALNIATNTMICVSKIGFRESRIILAQCVIYLAASPKSNTSYKAINKALEYVNKHNLDIPNNIKQHHVNYKYPHDFGGWVNQEYMKCGEKFVELSDIGFEKTIKEWLNKIKDM